MDGDFEQVNAKSRTLPAPQNFKANYNPLTNTTSFTWDAVDNADGYSILMGEKNDSILSAIVANFTGTSGTLTGYSSKIKTYYYWVIAYNTKEESEVTDSVSIVTKAGSPQDLKVTGNKDGFISLSWSEVVGATGYKVYQKRSTDENFVVFNEILTSPGCLITLHSYIDSIKYKVLGVKDSVDADDFSNEVTCSIDLFSPHNSKIEDGESYGSAKISWNTVGNIDTYKIYKTSDIDQPPVLIGTVTDSKNTFNVTGLTQGQYYFYVTSVNGETESSKGDALAYRVRLGAPQNITVTTKTSDSITLTWDTLENAVQYGFAVVDSNSNVKNVEKTTDTTVTISGLEPGEQYSIKICGIESDDTEGVYSSDKTVKTNIALPNKDSTKTVFHTTSAHIAWNEVKGATSYSIAYGTVNDVTTATVVSDITNLYCDITGLTVKTTYYYWLKAFDSTESYETGWSSTSYTGYTDYVLPINIRITAPDTSSYTLNWDVVGVASKYKITYKKNTTPSIDGLTENLLSDSCTKTSYDISSIINNRLDGYSYYFFTVYAYCDDGTWRQGSTGTTDNDPRWIYFGQTYEYGEKTQVPSEAILVTPKSTYYPSSAWAWTYNYSSGTTTNYYYFNCSKAGSYTIYIGDRYKNTSANLNGNSSTSSKTYVKWKTYEAGDASSVTYGYNSTLTWTVYHPTYIVIEVQNVSSSYYGNVGVQVVKQ